MHSPTTIRGLECAARAERERREAVRPPESTSLAAVKAVRSRRSSKDPQRITIETSPQVAALLDELAASGMYGCPQTREAAAEEVLRTALREIEMARRAR